MNITEIVSYSLNKDDNKPTDFLMTPAIAYLCFECDEDDEFEKACLTEDIYSDTKEELKALRRKKVSNVTGTVYKLTKEQKHCLRMLKKKYGRSLVKEIKEYRKKALAPYQVIKKYANDTKALYPKNVFGMTKEEYFKYKRSAEDKILNMRSNRALDLEKEMDKVNKDYKKYDELESDDLSLARNDATFNKVFKKYGIRNSGKFSDEDLEKYYDKMNALNKFKESLISDVRKSDLSAEDKIKITELVNQMKEVKKTAEANASGKTVSNLNNIKDLSKKISQANDISAADKEQFKSLMLKSFDKDIDTSYVTFEREFENYCLRRQIRKDVAKGEDNKYVDDYKYFIRNAKSDLSDRKSDLINQMSDERSRKSLTPEEKRIYELKPGARQDSDRLEDYTLKIKEDDFFDPVYFKKSDEYVEAEKKLDALIKRFERSLEAKLDPNDFALLKKYRLINNLVTVKNKTMSEMFFGGEYGIL